jgi:2-polyprenyl-3-methyl-5-hydroxy-6-metoxy-1,4-benzoquinol methylase
MKSAELQRKVAEHYPIAQGPDRPDFRVQKVRQLFTEYPPGRKVLDIGCADGSLLRPFVGKHELHGVDVAPEYLAGATALGYHTKVHDIESDALPYADATFDVVLAGETIEHLVDTDWFLSEINRVLKPGGHFIVTYPNVRTPVSLLMMLFFDMPPMYAARYRGPHYRDFTQKVIRIALRNHQFHPDKALGAHFHIPGIGDCLAGLASLLPSWSSQVVVRAVKTGESKYSPDALAQRDIYD